MAGEVAVVDDVDNLYITLGSFFEALGALDTASILRRCSNNTFFLARQLAILVYMWRQEHVFVRELCFISKFVVIHSE